MRQRIDRGMRECVRIERNVLEMRHPRDPAARWIQPQTITVSGKEISAEGADGIGMSSSILFVDRNLEEIAYLEDKLRQSRQFRGVPSSNEYKENWTATRK